MNPALRTILEVGLLARVVWLEARREPTDGKIALAYSILNRVEHPGWWGRDLASVVWKKWQYSSLTDPNDGQKRKEPTPYEPEDWRAWLECLEIALRVYLKEVPNPAPGADSYFSDSMDPPKWADPTRLVIKIGHHSFYDLDHDYERSNLKGM